MAVTSKLGIGFGACDEEEEDVWATELIANERRRTEHRARMRILPREREFASAWSCGTRSLETPGPLFFPKLIGSCASRGLKRSGIGRHTARLYIRPDKLDDGIHRRTGLKDCGYAAFLQGVDILIGDDAANQHQHIVHLVLLH